MIIYKADSVEGLCWVRGQPAVIPGLQQTEATWRLTTMPFATKCVSDQA